MGTWVTGHLEESVETALRADPGLARLAARALVLGTLYDQLDPTSDVGGLLDEINRDPMAIFWG